MWEPEGERSAHPAASDAGRPPDGGGGGGANCALHYVPEAYVGSGRLIVGRQSAGAGFLDAMARYGGYDALHCIADRPDVYQHFVERLAGLGEGAPTPARIDPQDYEALSRVGCVFHPGPIISESAWWRRFHGERAFSICGITHSVATERVIRSIRDFVVAPTQPWDALICTSRSARTALMRVRESWAEYLASRGIAIGESPVRTPIIPLGVHLERFARTDAAEAAGRALRAELGIAEGEVAILCFGRFDFRSKAHPAAAFRATELAALQTPETRLHLVMAGQAADAGTAMEFRRLAALCHSASVHWVDGSQDDRARAAWFAADLFLSLPDNVQESFGLTPVEAMAASLPCVVSDWNGYRETVADGETGILIPTLTAPAGAGIELADAHARNAFDHFTLIGLAAQATAVDIDRCAAAIAALAADQERRRRMGAAGRRRAEQLYDWRIVIRHYKTLWEELAALRAEAPAVGARDPARQTVHPDYPDPFAMFRDHPTAQLDPADRVRIADLDACYLLPWIAQGTSYLFAQQMLLDQEAISALVRVLERGPRTVEALAAEQSADDRARLDRTLVWLYKFGLVTIERPGPDRTAAPDRAEGRGGADPAAAGGGAP